MEDGKIIDNDKELLRKERRRLANKKWREGKGKNFHKEWVKKNPDKVLENRKRHENKEEIREKNRLRSRYENMTPERVKELKEYRREYLRKRREAMPKKEKKERVFIKREKTEEEKAAIKAKNSKRNKEYAKKNRKRLSEKHLERYRNNLSFKMASVLRCRVRKAIKQAKGIKFEKMKDIIGCDFKFFIDYIVSKFKPGMTLELLKSGKIHLDHIKPCAMFDLSKKEDQKACFHYTNIKPEWPEINFSKGARYVG